MPPVALFFPLVSLFVHRSPSSTLSTRRLALSFPLPSPHFYLRFSHHSHSLGNLFSLSSSDPVHSFRVPLAQLWLFVFVFFPLFGLDRHTSHTTPTSTPYPGQPTLDTTSCSIHWTRTTLLCKQTISISLSIIYYRDLKLPSLGNTISL